MSKRKEKLLFLAIGNSFEDPQSGRILTITDKPRPGAANCTGQMVEVEDEKGKKWAWPINAKGILHVYAG